MRRRILIAAAVSAGFARTTRAASPPGGPTVLELFTSQGCSSCPSADRLLGQLVQRPGVIALAWHVDYWDRLGWRDPFSSPEATARQLAYARSLGTEVYTPALVVGGARMAVGSDRRAIEAAIAAPLGERVPVRLTRSSAGLTGEIGQAPGTVMGRVSALLVFYLPEHTTPIGAGENTGRKLTEYRIVRGALELGVWDGAPRRLDLPAPPQGQGAVLLVQSGDLRVLGAASDEP